MCGLWSSSRKPSTRPDPLPEKPIRRIPSSSPSPQVQPRPSGFPSQPRPSALSSHPRPTGLSTQPSHISSINSRRSGNPAPKPNREDFPITTSFKVSYTRPSAFGEVLDSVLGPGQYMIEYSGDRYRVLSKRDLTKEENDRICDESYHSYQNVT